jgi:hypothetical protein
MTALRIESAPSAQRPEPAFAQQCRSDAGAVRESRIQLAHHVTDTADGRVHRYGREVRRIGAD